MENLYLYIGIGILLIIFIWFIATFNKIKRLANKIKESSSGIDVGLAKRYSVLTEMIGVVKGYVKHEEQTFVEITKLRSNMSIDEQEDAFNKMNENVRKINLLVEAYPNLKAVDTFVTLQKSLVDVEEHLQAARRLYNSNVTLYNNLIQTFPSLIVAKLMASTEKPYFEADASEKENVNIKID